MKKVGVLGATGYVGEELIRLLYKHPEVELSWLASHSYAGESFSSVYPHFKDVVEQILIEDQIDVNTLNIDVLFIALPHGIASKIVTKEVLEKTKVIDLGADFRLEKEAYDKWYKVEHHGEIMLKEAVYGLCEWQRENIKEARLIANPGCYVTCSLLSLLPLIKEGIIEETSIIIDAKSGVTGAGRGLNLPTHYTECNESIKAYGVAAHRHTPEIEEKLSYIGGKEITLTFTPHLVPMNRGILTTIYSNLKQGVGRCDVTKAYEKYYSREQFVRVLPEGMIAETRWVKGSNYCDISYVVDARTNRLVVVGSLDNMMKGAAAQAIQNMNIMMGWHESLGIDMLPLFPS